MSMTRDCFHTDTLAFSHRSFVVLFFITSRLLCLLIDIMAPYNTQSINKSSSIGFVFQSVCVCALITSRLLFIEVQEAHFSFGCVSVCTHAADLIMFVAGPLAHARDVRPQKLATERSHGSIGKYHCARCGIMQSFRFR